ncbi:MAG: HEAT repeat domain-containing protein [Verrucomicrobia bacterium]|nr:HEAT repeat domain-containing protein [Verrucomicrobiota bacterium]
MFKKCFLNRTLALAFGLAALSLDAAEIGADKKGGTGLKVEDRQPAPLVAPASKEAESNLKRIQVPAGLKLDLWAAEPMFANPVAFCLDEQGRVFVSETYRYRTSALDIRHYMFMLEDDMAARNVDDRLAYSKKWFGDKFKDLSIETEVVRLLEDRTGSGVANFSSIYADGFNTPLDGIASGTLARKGKVYFANIPNVWELSGMDKDGHATARKSMSYGYGVRYSFTGHDLHGLVIGPDGKLYFSFGDRGATVKTKEGKTLAFPDEGAVFRCNLDGSELEVVYRGLRNPQELVFDNYGNLFTGDNDFDHGDEERLVYVVEGGDSGWRVGYQHAPLGFDLVAWKSEHIWINHESRQADYNGKKLDNRVADVGIRPAAYLKPISNVGDGPSGFAFNPGAVALPAKYDGKFFLTHFKGAIGTSKIQTFRVKPDGAGFTLADSEEFLTQCQPTDVDFGPDGAVYFSDWGEGWERTKKGRLYRVYDEKLINSAEVLATKKLIGEGMDKRSTDELVKLLAHRDRRVRQEAQFALVDKKAADALANVAYAKGDQFARLHAIWGLGQLGRNDRRQLDRALGLLGDEDAEIRALTAKVLGDARLKEGTGPLAKALGDSNSRVQYFAAQALGRIGSKQAIPAIAAMLEKNNNADQFIRHGGAMALAGTGDAKAIAALALHSSAAVRVAAVLALRKLESAEIAVFLKDSDPAVVIEAARAINDAPVNAAMPQMAELLNAGAPAAASKWAQPFHLRAINANFRTGDAKSAKALVQFASTQTAPEEMRVEALAQLALWSAPPARDRVLGIYRPLPKRDARPAADALNSSLTTLLQSVPDNIRIAAADAAGKLQVKNAGALLFLLVTDGTTASKVRIAALGALAALKDKRLNDALKLASAAPDMGLRIEASRLLGQSGGASAIKRLTDALNKGGTAEKQSALSALTTMKGKDADKIISTWVERLAAGKVPEELLLDVLEAGATLRSPKASKALAAFNAARPKDDELAPFREVLHGGNAEAGRKIFLERADAQCLRCHKMKGEGSEVGPDLTTLGAQKPREYLLESIVLPNKIIAPGFDSVSVILKDEQEFSGVLKAETDTELTLAIPGAAPVKVKKADIASRRKGLSGMPEGFGQILSKRDLRDLVEFLATVK